MCDLCRALMANIMPYCDEIMQLLLENLGVSLRLLCVCVLMFKLFDSQAVLAASL